MVFLIAGRVPIYIASQINARRAFLCFTVGIYDNSKYSATNNAVKQIFLHLIKKIRATISQNLRIIYSE